MFERGQIVLVTKDFEGNNTAGKLGIILNIDDTFYKIGFFEKTEMSNEDTMAYQDKYSSIKSTWWVADYALKSDITKNKFK